MIIGVISDTHGLLSASALDALQGSELIIHAGDMGGPEVLETLERLAPVTAVRGNMDYGAWAESLPPTNLVTFNGSLLYIVHNLHSLDLEPSATGVKGVISGHTHQPEIRTMNGVLYFNPGSASYGRHSGPLSVGRIKTIGDRLHPVIIQINS